MLKKRLIAALPILDGIVVQSIKFEKYLPVGKPEIAVEFLSAWDVDEIILLDISASKNGSIFDLSAIKTISDQCFIPLTVGGGIQSIDQIRDVLTSGADKISINSAAIDRPDFVTEGANIFGGQCIVVSMDVKKMDDSHYEVFRLGFQPTGFDPIDWAQMIEARGAGELLVNSIDRDGTKVGYDISLIRRISEAVKIPVIALGGVGSPSHFVEGIISGEVDAVAAGNIFHWNEHSAVKIKSYMHRDGIPVRLKKNANYLERNEF
jgi:imidazole glycerol-phosphate synthase subunit HisF